MIKDFFRRLKEGTVHLNYGRDIISVMAEDHVHRRGLEEVHILDIGLDKGYDVLNI